MDRTSQKTCWVVTDGRIGMENQALGLAEAVGLPITLKRVEPQKRWAWLPSKAWPIVAKSFKNPLTSVGTPGDQVEPPWPDLLIGTGRLSIFYSIAIRRLSEGKTYTVQTQDPRVHCSFFDLVVPPTHDLYTGPNVVPILGAPHRVTDSKLNAEADRIAPGIAHLPRPLVAVLIGGKSNAYRFPQSRMEQICEDLGALCSQHGVGLIVTASRRTGDKNREILKQRLSNLPAVFWDGTGLNPYFGYLGLADHVVVTGDSTNMVTEAAATGKPVHILDLPGGNAKFRRFHRDMQDYGATRKFTGALDSWTYKPLDETSRVAAIIQHELDYRNDKATP